MLKYYTLREEADGAATHFLNDQQSIFRCFYPLSYSILKMNLLVELSFYCWQPDFLNQFNVIIKLEFFSSESIADSWHAAFQPQPGVNLSRRNNHLCLSLLWASLM